MTLQSGIQEKGETQLRKALLDTLSTLRGRPNLLKGPRGQTCEPKRALNGSLFSPQALHVIVQCFLSFLIEQPPSYVVTPIFFGHSPRVRTLMYDQDALCFPVPGLADHSPY